MNPKRILGLATFLVTATLAPNEAKAGCHQGQAQAVPAVVYYQSPTPTFSYYPTAFNTYGGYATGNAYNSYSSIYAQSQTFTPVIGGRSVEERLATLEGQMFRVMNPQTYPQYYPQYYPR